MSKIIEIIELSDSLIPPSYDKEYIRKKFVIVRVNDFAIISQRNSIDCSNSTEIHVFKQDKSPLEEYLIVACRACLTVCGMSDGRDGVDVYPGGHTAWRKALAQEIGIPLEHLYGGKPGEGFQTDVLRKFSEAIDVPLSEYHGLVLNIGS